MKKILVASAAAVALSAGAFAGNAYFTAGAGTLGGDFDNQARFSVGYETLNKNVFADSGTLSIELGMAYGKKNGIGYFDMHGSARPGYEIYPDTVVSAIFGVNGGSLDGTEIYGFDLGAGIRYYFDGGYLIGADYKRGFEKMEGGVNVDADTFYLTVGYSF